MIMILTYVCILLYGIDILSNSLDNALGAKIEKVIRKVTSSYFKCALVGTFFTMLTQSSTATTAILLSLLTAGIISLKSSIAVLMGANIGTTITSLITSFNINKYSYILIIVGILLLLFSKRQDFLAVGKIILGVGFIFYSLNLLEIQLLEYANNNSIGEIITKANSNNLLGIFSGTIISGLLQSSSATIAIGQKMYAAKIITDNLAVSIMLGANIGTTFTALISSVNLGKNAKTLSIAGLLLNVIGVVLVFPFINIYCEAFDSLGSDNLLVSFGHIIFNIASSVIGILFINSLEKISSFFTKKAS